MELYSAQQTLSRLQTQLERAEEEKRQLAGRRSAIESDLERLREWQETRVTEADARRAEADARQAELDRLNATLKRLEAQAAATREETSEARQNAFAAEKETKAQREGEADQDVLIDGLQETLKKLHEKTALYDAQRAAQAKETTLARQTLSEANAEMDAVMAEKKQLTGQWKSALVGNAKRDEALRATREALMEQTREMTLVEAETNAKKEQAKEESRKNEQLLALLRKTEMEAANAQKALTKTLDKKEKLAETYERLVVAQEETDAALDRARKEESALADASRVADESVAAAERDIRGLDEKMLANLSEQSTTEKDARRVVESTREIRRLIEAEETSTTNVQNEIARIRVETLHRRSVVDDLTEASAALEEESREKTRTVETYEAEIARREDEISRKSMEVTRLNRELDKRTSGVGGDANLGPMEANIKHLSKETEAKEKAIKELQRAWVGHQTELVALVNENTNVAEKTRRLKAEIAVATRRRSRLTENLARQKEEIKELDFAMERARGDARVVEHLLGENENGGASHRRDGQREGNLRKFERDGERHRGVGEQNPERFGREEARVGGSHRMRAPDYAVGTQDSAGARNASRARPRRRRRRGGRDEEGDRAHDAQEGGAGARAGGAHAQGGAGGVQARGGGGEGEAGQGEGAGRRQGGEGEASRRESSGGGHGRDRFERGARPCSAQGRHYQAGSETGVCRAETGDQGGQG